MAEQQSTTIRFSEPVYRRLEAASAETGLPINSIVVVACLEWLDAHPRSQGAAVPFGPMTPSFARLSVPRQRRFWRNLVTPGRGGGEIFDLLTISARRALAEAGRESVAANQDAIGTEDVVLGLTLVREGRAARVLEDLGAGAEVVKQAVDRRRRPGVEGGPARPTGRVRTALKRALERAREEENPSIGTIQLLLGILADPESVGAGVLAEVGVTEDRVRDAVGAIGAVEEP